jgi:hypothetical protein
MFQSNDAYSKQVMIAMHAMKIGDKPANGMTQQPTIVEIRHLWANITNNTRYWVSNTYPQRME